MRNFMLMVREQTVMQRTATRDTHRTKHWLAFGA